MMNAQRETGKVRTEAWPRVLPEGYEVRSGSIEPELCKRVYLADMEMGKVGMGIPTESTREEVIAESRETEAAVSQLIASLGGDAGKGYRIRHTAGEIDFLAKMSEG